MNNNLKLNLITMSPVPFYEGFVKQPTIQDIISIGEDEFNTNILPFAVTLDILNLESEQKSMFKTFDLFFLKNNDEYVLLDNSRPIIDILVESLRFFFNTDRVTLHEPKHESFILRDEKHLQPKIIIDNKIRIDRDNFDELQDLILLICQREKPKKVNEDEDIVITNEAQRRRYENLKRQREKARLKKAKEDLEKSSLANLINEIETHRDSSLDYSKMTIYKLITIYKNMFVKEQYDQTMRLASSGMIDTKEAGLDMTHWSEKVKL